MTSRFCVCRSSYVNPLTDFAGKQNKLASAQNLGRKSNVGSNEIPTKALTRPEAPISPFVPPPTKDLFTKFIKMYMETT